MRRLDAIEFGKAEVNMPDGTCYAFAGRQDGPTARMHLHDLSVLVGMMMGGNIALANDYRAGKWDSPNLPALIEFGLRNSHVLNRFIYGLRPLQMLTRLSYLLAMNNKKGSRKNIHAHYDLGNDFYRLWLDPSMTYSSALFHHHDEDLMTGQYNKYDRILDRFGHNPHHILEIGCGWGGFIRRSIERADHAMTSITISPAQWAYARARLDHPNAMIHLQDYREVKGRFDGIVSIEMFEAVGERYWPTYFTKLKSLLAHKGRAVIQTITIGDAYFPSYRVMGDAIRSYIFPGGMLPSPQRFKQEAERADLKIADCYTFGHDYARTLALWLMQFENQAEAIKAQHFDEGFVRLWRFYLASCMAAFTEGRVDVMQVELRHA
ncbi:MAG: cyclopropane-fatty-acyl-phospholipid synthase family protein [Pseudomonadota bacterium]